MAAATSFFRKIAFHNGPAGTASIGVLDFFRKRLNQQFVTRKCWARALTVMYWSEKR
jgi:hypothetical protein